MTPLLLQGASTAQIVAESSARQGLVTFFLVPTDHFRVCQPASQTSANFQQLVDFVDSATGSHVVRLF
jgi:hypothetical protein